MRGCPTSSTKSIHTLLLSCLQMRQLLERSVVTIIPSQPYMEDQLLSRSPSNFTVTIPVSNYKRKQSHSCIHETRVHLEVVSESKKGTNSFRKQWGLFQVDKTPHHSCRANYCKYNTAYCNSTSQEGSVNVFCVQIETDLSGRHCVLKHCHDVFLTLSRSLRVTVTEYTRSAVDYAKTGRWSLALSLLPKLQFTLYRGYQPSIVTLIENKSVRSELEVVIRSRSVVLKTTSTVRWK